MEVPTTLPPLRGYRLVAALGEGTSGIVWRAEKAGKDYAIKILKPGFERFVLAEFGTLRRLDHPNIIEEYEIGSFATRYCQTGPAQDPEQWNGRLVLVMELLRGTPLEKAHQEDYSPAELEHIVTGIAEALQAAHAQGVIHRDLKPANVFITPDKQAKVLDFGVASGISYDPHERVVAGSYSYMAPTQLMGTADLQNDIWSFGVTGYHFLTGEHPYAARTLSELSEKLLLLEVDSPNHRNPRLSPKLSYVILKCLRKNLRERYRNFDEILHDLREDPVRQLPADLKVKQPDRLAVVLLRRKRLARFFGVAFKVTGYIFFPLLLLLGYINQNPETVLAGLDWIVDNQSTGAAFVADNRAALTQFVANVPFGKVLLGGIALLLLLSVVPYFAFRLGREIGSWRELLQAGTLLPAAEHEKLVDGLQQKRSGWPAEAPPEDREYFVFWNWKHGRAAAAGNLADRLLLQDPQNVTALNFWVQKFYREQNLDQVRAYGQRLLTLNPDDVILLFFQHVLGWELPTSAAPVDQLAATAVSVAPEVAPGPPVATAAPEPELAIPGRSALVEAVFESGFTPLDCHLLEKDAVPFLRLQEWAADTTEDWGYRPDPRSTQLVLYRSYLESKATKDDILPRTLAYRSISHYAEAGRLIRIEDFGWVRLAFAEAEQLQGWCDLLRTAEVPGLAGTVSAYLSHHDGTPYRDEWTQKAEKEEEVPTTVDGKETTTTQQVVTETPLFRHRPRRVIFVPGETYLECIAEDRQLPQRIAYADWQTSSGPEPAFRITPQGAWYRIYFDDEDMQRRWTDLCTRRSTVVPDRTCLAQLVQRDFQPVTVETTRTVKTYDPDALLPIPNSISTSTLLLANQADCWLELGANGLRIAADSFAGTFDYATLRPALRGQLLGIADRQWLGLAFAKRDRHREWYAALTARPLPDRPLRRAPGQSVELVPKRYLPDFLDRILQWFYRVFNAARVRREAFFGQLILHSQYGAAATAPPASGTLVAEPFTFDFDRQTLRYRQAEPVGFAAITRIQVDTERWRMHGDGNTVIADIAILDYPEASFFPLCWALWGERIDIKG